MKRRRIMFLDFDGCCNSYAEGSYRTNKNDTYGPSKSICKMLKEFCLKNSVDIVISSNWRKFEKDGYYIFDGNKVYNPLEKLYNELGDVIVGTLTPERHIRKAECVILWFEDNDGEDCDYVIFDDDLREGFQTTFDHGIREHFVKTDPEFGITEKDLQKASIILNIENKKEGKHEGKRANGKVG